MDERATTLPKGPSSQPVLLAAVGPTCPLAEGWVWSACNLEGFKIGPKFSRRTGLNSAQRTAIELAEALLRGVGRACVHMPSLAPWAGRGFGAGGWVRPTKSFRCVINYFHQTPLLK